MSTIPMSITIPASPARKIPEMSTMTNKTEVATPSLLNKTLEAGQDSRDEALQRLWCEAIIATQDGTSGRMVCDVETLLHYVNTRKVALSRPLAQRGEQNAAPLSLGELVTKVALTGEPHTMTEPEKQKFFREFYESVAPEIKRIRALRSPEHAAPDRSTGGGADGMPEEPPSLLPEARAQKIKGDDLLASLLEQHDAYERALRQWTLRRGW